MTSMTDWLYLLVPVGIGAAGMLASYIIGRIDGRRAHDLERTRAMHDARSILDDCGKHIAPLR